MNFDATIDKSFEQAIEDAEARNKRKDEIRLAMIRPIQVFKQFDPEDYLEYCKMENETPTQEGFIKFLGSEIPEGFDITEL